MGLLSSANRCGCKNLLSCNLLRCACCCSWIRRVCGRKEATREASTSSETKRSKKRKWLRGVCGGTGREAEEASTSDAKKKKKGKWLRGICGGTVREAVPLTSESKKKTKKNPTDPETEKCKWIKKRAWKKKKKEKKKDDEQTGLANLVQEISISNSPKNKAATGGILRISNNNIPSRVFTFRELADATNSFSQENMLGEGSFGRVYKGYIPDTKKVIAVKQFDKDGLQGNREFLVEVLMLCLLRHPNLVTLLGYSTECEQRILVYEYMPLGSLQDHLLDLTPNSQPLPWHTRMKIACDAARGMEYLHEIANPPVIYRDLKASNILLDGTFNAKLSDFGLANLGPVGGKSGVSTRVMGTYGYCAPEYAVTGKLTKMSDMYSFGIVLLQLITGRRAIDTTKPTREQILVHWAAPFFRDKDKSKFVKMADPTLDGKYPLKALYQALAISSMCLQEEASSRPLISDVVTALTFLADPNYDPPEDIKDPLPIAIPNSPKETRQTETGGDPGQQPHGTEG